MSGLLSSALWWAIFSKIKSSFPSVKDVSVEELQQAMEMDKESVLLLDVRRKDEYDVSHLEGAVWVGEDGEDGATAEQAVCEFVKMRAGRNAKVYCYCSVGYRSARLVEKMGQKEVVSDGIYNVKGSIFEWANKGQPVVSNDGRRMDLALVHPYNSVWGMLLDADKRSK